MASRLERCPRCGKVFVARPDKKVCGQCVALEAEVVSLIEEAVNHFGIRSPEEIAQFARVSVSEVERLLKKSDILGEPTGIGQQTCSRCHENTAQPHSDFCLRCRLVLSRELGDAAESLAVKVKGLGPGKSAQAREGGPLIRGTPTGVSQTLASKRYRSSPRGGGYTPKGRY